MARLLTILAILGFVGFLIIQFPYALDSNNSKYRFLYLLILLLLLSRRIRHLKWHQLSRITRDILIWAAIALVLLLGYSFRDELGKNRLMAELLPQQVQVNNDGTLSIRASEGGHFFIRAQVNATPVRFMVDTGASDIVLSPADARRAGIAPEHLDYNRIYSTANGSVTGASVVLAELNVGTITLKNIAASVNHTDMNYSLLGMNFLHKLQGFRVEGNTLVLIP